MTSVPHFYSMLLTDADDRERADLLFAWMAEQPEAVRHTLEYWLSNLAEKGLGENGAAAMLYETILYVTDTPDEQDRKRSHGESVRSAFEWEEVKRKRRTPVKVEEVAA